MARFVYADNAATTPVSPTVFAAMKPFYTDLYGNPSSLYSVGREAKKHLELARADVAACLNAEPNEIFFTSGGSEADNWAIKGIAHQLAKKGKKHIITSKFEHHAVLHTCQYLEQKGYEVTYLDVDENGIIQSCVIKGGCPGNLLGISRIVIGMKAEDVIERFRGTRCGFKSTSCPDQLASAITEYKKSCK